MKKIFTLLTILLIINTSKAQFCEESEIEFIPLTASGLIFDDVVIELRAGITPIDTITINAGFYDSGTYPVMFGNSPITSTVSFTGVVLSGTTDGVWAMRVRQQDIIGGGINSFVDWDGSGDDIFGFSLSPTSDFDHNGNQISKCTDYAPNYTPVVECDYAIQFDVTDNLQVVTFWKDNLNLMYSWNVDTDDTIAIQYNTLNQYIEYVDYSGLNRPLAITTKFNGATTTTTLSSGSIIDVDATAAACNSALPVELTYFVGTKVNEFENELKWQTASEDGNSHFELQHSNSLSNFEVIDVIQGAGTTQSVKNYKARHTPVKAGEYNYYRLKQIDLDGDFEYSKIVVVKGGKRTDEISVRPTEVKTTATIVFPESQVDEILEVFNLQGQKVMSKKIEIGNTVAYVDFSEIASGMYFARLGKRTSTKFIKM